MPLIGFAFRKNCTKNSLFAPRPFSTDAALSYTVRMKVYLVRRAFFTFRQKKSYDLDLAGESCLARMQRNLGAETIDGAPPSGEKLVLYPVFPFLTREKLDRFLAVHTGSLRFRGGFLERGGSFREGSDPDEGLYSLADYPSTRRRAFRESALSFAARGALVEEGADVDVTARLAGGAVGRRGAGVRGESVVGADAVIGAGSVVEESVIGDGTGVEGSYISHSVVGAHCSVGPYAHLRPGTNVGCGVRIGAFVECKNANIGDGCKLSHLAYVGDADLGERVNVGCGVVFVNYDGKRKSRTRVGKGAFLGSNCNLIAPVRVGDGCFLAAGTTLTRDLADGDFCIGRSRETIKPSGAGKYLE